MLVTLGCCIILLMGCGSGENAVNLFSLQDDLALGEQVREEIEGDSSEMIILDSTVYPAIYGYVYSIRDSLLNSGQVRFKS